MIPEIFNDQKKVTFYNARYIGYSPEEGLTAAKNLFNKNGTVFSTSLENAIRNYLRENYDENANPPFQNTVIVTSFIVRKKIFKKSPVASDAFDSTNKPTDYLIDLLLLTKCSKPTIISRAITAMPETLFQAFSPVLDATRYIGLVFDEYYITNVDMSVDEIGNKHFNNFEIKHVDYSLDSEDKD